MNTTTENDIFGGKSESELRDSDATIPAGNDLLVYADGSSMIGLDIAGWAFAAIQNGRIVNWVADSQDNATNNRVEFLALLHALKWINCNAPESNVTIRTDSLNVVNTVNIWYSDWIANGKLHKKANNDVISKVMDEIHRLKCNYKVQWVKGHGDDKFNAFVDKKAKAEMRMRVSEIQNKEEND